MSALANALEQYELAIALGAAPKVKQALFEVLTTAHNAHVAHLTEMREAEEALARTWGRLLNCLDAPDEWVTINGMPGTSCKTCGMPTESEPCETHQPAAYARCNS